MSEVERLLGLLDETRIETRAALGRLADNPVVYPDSGWRVKDVLAHVAAWEDEAARSLRFGGFRFDPARGELFRGGEIVRLTAAEAGLLSSLAARAGEAVSREDLSQSAQFSGNIRNVDVQMTRLRRKIEADSRYPRYLHTVRGTGYVLKPD